MWTKRRSAYIVMRNFGPPLNIAMGIAIGTQKWWLVGVLLIFYLVNMTSVDFLFWTETDKAQQETRHRLEKKLGVR